VVLNQVINEHVHVNQYDLLHFGSNHNKNILKIKGEYIKAEEIVQNKPSTRICLPYFDSGYFRMYIFDSASNIVCHLKDINKLCNINYKSRPPHGF